MRSAGGARILTVVGAVLISVAGWFYVQNIIQYGTPFQMSRETLTSAGSGTTKPRVNGACSSTSCSTR